MVPPSVHGHQISYPTSKPGIRAPTGTRRSVSPPPPATCQSGEAGEAGELFCASMRRMGEERRIRPRTPEWTSLYARIQVAMELTSRLNVLPFGDLHTR